MCVTEEQSKEVMAHVSQQEVGLHQQQITAPQNQMNPVSALFSAVSQHLSATARFVRPRDHFSIT